MPSFVHTTVIFTGMFLGENLHTYFYITVLNILRGTIFWVVALLYLANQNRFDPPRSRNVLTAHRQTSTKPSGHLQTLLRGLGKYDNGRQFVGECVWSRALMR